jgi:hypothetical protein
VKSKKTMNRSPKTSNRADSIAERRKIEDRRRKKRRAHPRVAVAAVPTDRRSDERRSPESR